MVLLVWWTGPLYLLLGGLIGALLIILVVGYELLRRELRRLAQSNETAAKAVSVDDQLKELNRRLAEVCEQVNRLTNSFNESVSARQSPGPPLFTDPAGPAPSRPARRRKKATETGLRILNNRAGTEPHKERP